MTNPLNDTIATMVERMRDAGRPDIDDVIYVLKEAFPSQYIELQHTGPDTWIWSDISLAKAGIPKFYILSKSTQEGSDGYPLLTIRQAYSVRLDTWVTMSCLVVGPDTSEIARSVSLLMANHMCAFAGVRQSTAAITAAGGDPQAGLAFAKELMAVDMGVPDLSLEQVASILEQDLEGDDDPSKMN